MEQKKLTKLTYPNGKPIYIDLSKVDSVQELEHYHLTGMSLNSTNTVPDQYPARTVIISHGQHYHVHEHLFEVLAIIENKDPYPAQVLYGKKKPK